MYKGTAVRQISYFLLIISTNDLAQLFKIGQVLSNEA